MIRWSVLGLCVLLSGCVEPPAQGAAVVEPAPEPLYLVVRGYVEDEQVVVRLTAFWDDGRARPFEGWVEVFMRPDSDGQRWVPRYWLTYADEGNFSDTDPAYFEMRGDASWLRPGEPFVLDADARTWNGYRLEGEYHNRA